MDEVSVNDVDGKAAAVEVEEMRRPYSSYMEPDRGREPRAGGSAARGWPVIAEGSERWSSSQSGMCWWHAVEIGGDWRDTIGRADHCIDER